MDTERRCSFCNKAEHEVVQLVLGPNVNICDGCVRIAANIIESSAPRPFRLLTIVRRALKFLRKTVGVGRRGMVALAG